MKLKLSTFAIYLATIPLANWFIGNVGTLSFPGGPHTIPVGFGYDAPSGVLLIGFALFARDILQEVAGRKWVLVAIGAGLPLSYLVNPMLAVASTVAFVLSELLDLAVYSKLRARNKPVAVAVSGFVGGVADSFLFLWLAFGSIKFWEGQVIGKTGMAILFACLLAVKNVVSERVSAVKT